MAREWNIDLLELMKYRRAIRKYLDKKIEREKLEEIAEAGIYAPSPGGRQGAKVIMLEDAALIDKIGVINADCENRDWGGKSVCTEQPSIIDDLSIKSGFYGAPALGIVCVPKSMAAKVNGIGSAFVCAENMVLAACNLGVSSCIVGRAEATFSHPEADSLLSQWNLDDDYTPMVFVCLGYINGDYPAPKPRHENRILFPN